MESVLLDAAGHRRSPATMPGYHRGRPPRNKGEEYPADPPTVEEIVAVMRAIGDRSDGHRLRALIVLLWRAGLRISEALALQESDLDRACGAVLVRRGKGGNGARSGWTAGHRQQRDHHHRSRTAIADDLRQRWPSNEALAPQASGRLRLVPADPTPYPRLAMNRARAVIEVETCIRRRT